MATQTKLWKHHTSVRSVTLGLDQRAADQAWIAKCVADRQSERLATSMHIYQASLQGFSAHAAG